MPAGSPSKKITQATVTANAAGILINSKKKCINSNVGRRIELIRKKNVSILMLGEDFKEKTNRLSPLPTLELIPHFNSKKQYGF